MTTKKSSKAVKPKSQPKSASKSASAPKKTVKDFAKKVAKKVKQTPKETTVEDTKKIGDDVVEPHVEQPHITNTVDEFEVPPVETSIPDDVPADVSRETSTVDDGEIRIPDGFPVYTEPARPEVEAAALDDNPDYAANIALPTAETNPSQYDYSIDTPHTLIPLMRDAWNAIRPKSDAPFEVCAPAFRETLLAHAIDVIKTDKVQEGDSPLANFEREIYRLTH